MINLQYQSHESLQALESHNYMTNARMLVFLEYGGLETEGVLTEANLEPWLEEKLGWEIHTGAYRYYWDYLGQWQKYRMPKAIPEEDKRLLEKQRTLFGYRIQDYVPRLELFYAIEQYARHDLFFVESATDSQLIVALANKLSFPLLPYRTRFTFSARLDRLCLPEIRAHVQDWFEHKADYFEWSTYGAQFEYLTRSPYSPHLNNSVLYDYALFRIPSKQLYVTLCPTDPRWIDRGHGLYEDTYRFDSGSQSLWRVVENEPVPFRELSLCIGSHDHLFHEAEGSSRQANLQEYTELLLSKIKPE